MSCATGAAETVTFVICTSGAGQPLALRHKDRVALRQKYVTEIFQKCCVTSVCG